MSPYTLPALLSTLERLHVLHLAAGPEQVLRSATEIACLVTSSARGMAGLAGPTHVSTQGWFDAEAGWTDQPISWERGKGAPGHVCQSGKPLVCNALPETADGLSEATDLLKVTSFACVPLSDTDGTTLGFLEVGNKLDPYAPGDVRLLNAVATHAAIRLAELGSDVSGSVADTLRAALVTEPQGLPEGAEIAVACRYREEFGGDFVDAFSFSPRSVAVSIGDVSGKGIAAATLAITAKHTLRAIAASRWPPRVGQAVAETNNVLELQVGAEPPSEGRLPQSRFVTLELALMDIEHGALTFASAGHPAPFVLRAGGIERPLLLAGPAAGVAPAFEPDPYSPERVTLQRGEAVLFFTDGVSEARDAEGRFYEEQRMEEALDELRGRPA
ncbi:MAG TPA: GAF domain-containing SpoIIE family protein phosphatase, partial [Thermoleophilia bacterium]|nr:GAF domain-containing SpoIIE family protein phosphatase [Thermoleophilia bacterium]